MIDKFIKKDAEQVRKILRAVIFVLAAMIVVKIATLAVSMIRTPSLIKTAVAQGTVSKEKVAEYLASDSEKIEALKKKNMFIPPPPKPGPPSVTGILGKSALINGKWYKAGEKVSGAKILRIEPTQIVIEWQGKEMPLAPLLASTGSVKIDAVEKAPEKKKRHRPKQMKQLEEQDQEQTEAVEEDPLAWMGVKLSPALRAKILETWNQLTDEQKEQFKQQWNSMTDEQKQAAMSAMEQQL